MDENIERVVKTCRGWKLAAKAPLIRYKPWPQMDLLLSRIHIDSAGPLNGFYSLVVVNGYTKWSEIFKCQKPTATTRIHALKECQKKLSVITELSLWEVKLEIFVDHCQLNMLLPFHTIQGQMNKPRWL